MPICRRAGPNASPPRSYSKTRDSTRLPVEVTAKNPKSRRVLFSHKEAKNLTPETGSDSPPAMKGTSYDTQHRRKGFAKIERMIRRILDALTSQSNSSQPRISQSQSQTMILSHATEPPSIVLTGMSRAERKIVQSAIKTLNGSVQDKVDRCTTHVLFGSCQRSNQSQLDNTGTPDQTTRGSNMTTQIKRCTINKPRTLKALLGAARGCKILHAQWAMDCLEVKKWLHHHGYEVMHLRKISQIARAERAALGRICKNYSYNIFNGTRVKITPYTKKKEAAIELLTLCGAVVQNGGQDGRRETDFDVCLGRSEGQLSSKWVFDSVAAGRMRKRTKSCYLKENAHKMPEMYRDENYSKNQVIIKYEHSE